MIGADFEIENRATRHEELVRRIVGSSVRAVERSADQQIGRPAAEQLIAAKPPDRGVRPTDTTNVNGVVARTSVSHPRYVRDGEVDVVVEPRADDLLEILDCVDG